MMASSRKTPASSMTVLTPGWEGRTSSSLALSLRFFVFSSFLERSVGFVSTTPSEVFVPSCRLEVVAVISSVGFSSYQLSVVGWSALLAGLQVGLVNCFEVQSYESSGSRRIKCMAVENFC